MEEVRAVIVQQEGTVSCNFEEVEGYIKERLKEYDGAIFTEESKGYDEMMKRLCPDKIIFYGSVPDDCKGDIIRIKPFSDKFNVVEVAAW